ncbi:MAG TPA: PQQ-binding-like beta-propeller repeat protein [Methylomirabilota bacterium]|nr:PQQ-binding-like beta-propeller repeat protein [Methylomirabilota bacterium]
MNSVPVDSQNRPGCAEGAIERMHPLRFPFLILLLLVGLPRAAGAGSNAVPDALRYWPQWRGPLANGVAPHADPPVEWSEKRNIRWKVALPGKGHSSPIVWGDRVYLTSAVPVGEAQPPVYDKAPGSHDNVGVTHRHEFVVLALNRADGRLVWRRRVREELPHEGGHVTGSLASNSPTTDGERIFAFFGSRGLYCLDRNGEVKWEKDLGRMNTLHGHGEGSSPVLHGEVLVVCWDHEGDSFLHAFDKRSGRSLWKVPRDEKTSWSTPLIVQHEGRTQVVVSASRRVRGYDLATGAELWQCAGLTDNVVSSPVFGQGLVFAGNSYYSQAMLAIRLAGARGDITGTSNVVWTLNRLTPYVSSPLFYDDTLYFIRHNQNVLSRFEPLSGRPRGEPLRLDGIRDFIFSSPVGAAGRIYVTARDGITVVLRHDRENAIVAVNRLDDSFSATAALVDGELFLRGERSLYCVAAPRL